MSTTAATLANKQKKELAKVDHSGIDYTPFRKAFYMEVPEIARMTPEEVEQYREVCHISVFKTSYNDMQFNNTHTT